MTVCWRPQHAIWSNCLGNIVCKSQVKHDTLCVENAMFGINLVKTHVCESNMVSASSPALNALPFEGSVVVRNHTDLLEECVISHGSMFLNNRPQGQLSPMSRDIPASIRREAQSREFQPSIRIGTSGITENLIEEIDGQLSKRTLVKIKINRGLFERKDIDGVWAHLAQETNSTLVLARGNVGVLWR